VSEPIHPNDVHALESALRVLAEYLTQSEVVACGLMCLRLRRAAGMEAKLVALAGRVQWHREAGNLDDGGAA
jgi:hypothetical protein